MLLNFFSPENELLIMMMTIIITKTVGKIRQCIGFPRIYISCEQIRWKCSLLLGTCADDDDGDHAWAMWMLLCEVNCMHAANSGAEQISLVVNQVFLWIREMCSSWESSLLSKNKWYTE